MSDQPVSSQKNNPLHGLTLEAIVTALVAHYGWEKLGQEIAIRCFTQDPSIKSSLKFLRKTPWAREKVESLYLYVQRKQAKQAGSHSV
ncbi:VF530 family DNA-binding protein [Aeromonas sp. FDAARGOS 1415]|uniref:VF530 family protein n=1 Tax=Aeromonas TaxID=642 RepID=UPI001C232E0B|nr:VF530 family protein [Aeromonas sp. FDAARGOS 1415]QXB53091.1 VF530 family protein [Aeromonas sp. FDAARGOS 1415]